MQEKDYKKGVKEMGLAALTIFIYVVIGSLFVRMFKDMFGGSGK